MFIHSFNSCMYIYVNIALVILRTCKYSDNVNIALNIVNIVIMYKYSLSNTLNSLIQCKYTAREFQ